MRVALFLALAASGAAAAATTGQHVDRPQKTNGPVRRRRGAVTRRVSETVAAAPRRADDLPETRMEPNPEPVPPQLYDPSEGFMTPNEQMEDFIEQEFEAKAEEGILLDPPDDDAEEFDEYEDELDASMSFEYDSMSTSMSADNSSMSMSIDNSSMSTSYESMSQDYDDDDAVMSESVSAKVRRRRRRRVTSWNRARVQQERDEDVA